MNRFLVEESVFLIPWNYEKFVYIKFGLSSARSDIVSNFPLCSREPVLPFIDWYELPTLTTLGERSIRLRLLGSFFHLKDLNEKN